jgi:hypothetical protein
MQFTLQPWRHQRGRHTYCRPAGLDLSTLVPRNFLLACGLGKAKVLIRGVCKEPFNVMRAAAGQVPQKSAEYRYKQQQSTWVDGETIFDYALFFCGRIYNMDRLAWILLECNGPVREVKGPFTAGPFITSHPLPPQSITFSFSEDCFRVPLGKVVDAHKHGRLNAEGNIKRADGIPSRIIHI